MCFVAWLVTSDVKSPCSARPDISFAFSELVQKVRSPFERHPDDRWTRGENCRDDGRGGRCRSYSVCPVVVRAKRREVGASRRAPIRCLTRLATGDSVDEGQANGH